MLLESRDTLNTHDELLLFCSSRMLFKRGNYLMVVSSSQMFDHQMSCKLTRRLSVCTSDLCPLDRMGEARSLQEITVRTDEVFVKRGNDASLRQLYPVLKRHYAAQFKATCLAISWIHVLISSIIRTSRRGNRGFFIT